MLKDGGKLGNTTEFTVLRDDLCCAIPVFPFPSLGWIQFYLVLVTFRDNHFDFAFM